MFLLSQLNKKLCYFWPFVGNEMFKLYAPPPFKVFSKKNKNNIYNQIEILIFLLSCVKKRFSLRKHCESLITFACFKEKITIRRFTVNIMTSLWLWTWMRKVLSFQLHCQIRILLMSIKSYCVFLDCVRDLKERFAALNQRKMIR